MKSNRILLILGIVMLVNALSFGTIIPLLYPYASQFGINATSLSFLFASYSFAQFLATPVIGRMSDKYGRKPMLVMSLLGTSASLALFASAQSIGQLFIARILDGITGGNISVAQAIIADTSKGKDRATRFGMLGAIFGFGFAIGPAIGSVLSTISLTAPFWFASIFALFGTFLALVLLPETRKKTLKLKKSTSLSAKVLVDALTHPVVGAVLVVSFVAMTGNNAMIIGFQSFTVDVLSMSARDIGLLFTMFGIMQIVVQGFLLRYILQLHKSKRVLMRGSLLGASLAILATSFTHSYWPFAILVLLFGIFFAPVGAIVTGLISERTHDEDQGVMLGINQSLTSLAQIVGPLVAGVVVLYGTPWIFRLTSVICVLGFLLVGRIGHKMTKADI